MIVNMLLKWSHWYSSHHSDIKYIGFESINYAINLNILSSCIAFNKFDYVFFIIEKISK